MFGGEEFVKECTYEVKLIRMDFLRDLRNFNKEELSQTFSETKDELVLVPWEEWHGFRGNKEWEFPIRVTQCNYEARPGYASMKAHEYNDTEQVLLDKVKLLAQMLRESKNCIAYTGAGISTSSGIHDYASSAAGDKSVAAKEIRKHVIKSPLHARPSFSHRTLAALYDRGILKKWIQQNHDGIPQKAGVPQIALNEIHGAWFDPSNPVVAMSGNLRDDLFQDLLLWEDRADLCLSLGTSLCGMNADRVVSTTSHKAKRYGKTQGSVIIGLQRTQYDDVASLRIFAKLDDVFHMLADEMSLPVLPMDHIYQPIIPAEYLIQEDVFSIPFDENGYPSQERTVLDLRPGSYLRITGGSGEGNIGMVVNKTEEGHYKIHFLEVVNHLTGFKGPKFRLLGNWWVHNAVQGDGIVEGGLFPLVSRCSAEEIAEYEATMRTFMNRSKSRSRTVKDAKIIPREIYVGNRHRFLDDDDPNSHEWEFFISSSSEEIVSCTDFLNRVVIRLHPTFNPNVLDIELKEGDIVSIKRMGWGTFRIEAELHFHEHFHRDPAILFHELDFSQDFVVSEKKIPLRRPANPFLNQLQLGDVKLKQVETTVRNTSGRIHVETSTSRRLEQEAAEQRRYQREIDVVVMMDDDGFLVLKTD